jgi:hypothetical protein
MRRAIPLASLSLALLCALPAPAAPTDPKKDPDPKDKLVATGEIVGKLGQVEGTSKWFTVQVTQRVQVPNPGAIQNVANYQAQLVNQQAQLADAVRRKDAGAIQNLQVAIVQTQAALQQNLANRFTVEQRTVNLELQAADDIKVRHTLPPVAFDDKGKPKRYTQKELNELKGPDKRLPGYTASFEGLRPGQDVHVYLARKKDSGKSSKDPEKDPKSNRPLVTIIVILREPPK